MPYNPNQDPDEVALAQAVWGTLLVIVTLFLLVGTWDRIGQPWF